MMLGFTADATYTNSETGLEAGDVVFFYTDGVTEARNRAGEFLDRRHVRLWLESKRPTQRESRASFSTISRDGEAIARSRTTSRS